MYCAQYEPLDISLRYTTIIELSINKLALSTCACWEIENDGMIICFINLQGISLLNSDRLIPRTLLLHYTWVPTHSCIVCVISSDYAKWSFSHQVFWLLFYVYLANANYSFVFQKKCNNTVTELSTLLGFKISLRRIAFIELWNYL